jgi:hypothetical protein
MKTFRPWDVDQDWLLPPSLGEFVPADHIAHFIRDLVRNELDLTPILSSYDDDRGYPPYHPGMMVALLLYAIAHLTGTIHHPERPTLRRASGGGQVFVTLELPTVRWCILVYRGYFAEQLFRFRLRS